MRDPQIPGRTDPFIFLAEYPKTGILDTGGTGQGIVIGSIIDQQDLQICPGLLQD
jgi:hypothetical protein